MTEAQGPSPEDPQKPFVLGPLARANAPEDDEEFWDLDKDDAADEGKSIALKAEGVKASATPFFKGDSPEVAQKPIFSVTPLEPRESKAETRSMGQTDVPDEPKSGKPSKEVLLSHVDDAFAALELGEVEEAPVFALGEAPPASGEVNDPHKRMGFADETAGLEGCEFKQVESPKNFGEWLSGCSLVEKASLLAVIVLLTGFAVLLFFPAIGSLPDEKERARAEDFPKKSKHFMVKSAQTYWREPIESGPNADVFKRGTVLLPTIQMEVEGGPAVLRVLFRGEDGVVVGDSVTREVSGNEVVKVAGTEGFLELGMHAAYRTGQTKPWMVQVYEAKPGENEIQDFVLIFEMDMSAFLQ